MIYQLEDANFFSGLTFLFLFFKKGNKIGWV